MRRVLLVAKVSAVGLVGFKGWKMYQRKKCFEDANSPADLIAEDNDFNYAKALPMHDGSKFAGNISFFGNRFGEGESWDKIGHYKGWWVNNVKSGHGVLKYQNGFIYEGEFANDLPNGHGTLTLRDGTVYEGEFVNGILQGQPRILNRLTYVYEGDTLDGKAHGRGTMTYRWGTVLEGEFCEGELTGQGKMTLNGKVSEGEFKNSELHGHGTVTLESNAGTLEGTFVHGRMHGKSSFTLQVGISGYLTMVCDNINGPASLVSPEGVLYEGNMISKYMHGHCKFTACNGLESAEGCFEYGVMVGRWTFTDFLGRVYSADFPISTWDLIIILYRRMLCL